MTKLREGDTILIRGTVQSVRENNVDINLRLFGGQNLRVCVSPESAEKVEPKFVIGDRVSWRADGQLHTGSIMFIDADDPQMPPSALLNEDKRLHRVFRALNTLTRLEP